ncbi:MAG: hypothetical protein R3F23_08285 [Verrucomicrobiia bacterium]
MKPIILNPLSRRAYAFWGIGLMALKYNIDRAIAYFGFPPHLVSLELP